MWKKEYLPEPDKCDVCKSHVSYSEHQQKFGVVGRERTIGIWKCKSNKCRALVSCHPGTKNPVGYMAQEPLRRMRTECHKVFDQLWCHNDSPFTRHSAYFWMSQVLGISEDVANISKLTEDQIRTIMVESRRMMQKHKHDSEAERKGSRHSLRDKKIQTVRKSKVKVNARNYQNYI